MPPPSSHPRSSPDKKGVVNGVKIQTVLLAKKRTFNKRLQYRQPKKTKILKCLLSTPQSSPPSWSSSPSPPAGRRHSTAGWKSPCWKSSTTRRYKCGLSLWGTGYNKKFNLKRSHSGTASSATPCTSVSTTTASSCPLTARPRSGG